MMKIYEIQIEEHQYDALVEILISKRKLINIGHDASYAWGASKATLLLHSDEEYMIAGYKSIVVFDDGNNLSYQEYKDISERERNRISLRTQEEIPNDSLPTPYLSYDRYCHTCLINAWTPTYDAFAALVEHE